MRILAIRGKNLASLADPFEVEFEQGVLKHVGLFAITGSTGAGKSTILDALCLALYDKMPRLPAGHGVAVGHKDEDDTLRVKSHDVSSILRRGTANAYAEVDFIGKDKHSYRARWEISRARGKVDGRLQAQKISLLNLDSLEKLGEKKTDILEAIEKCIGLTFDQFRRSVLLAQGDFAAFLQAKKDERSNLLEKITGTDIYTELSIAAFERAKQEQRRLDAIKEKLVDKTPLTDEERTRLEQEKQQIADLLATINQQLKTKEVLIDWFNTQKKWLQQQNSAEQLVEQSQQAWDNNKQDRDYVQQVEQVQVLRPVLQQVDDLSQEFLLADETVKNSQQAIISAEKLAEDCAERLKNDSKVHIDCVQQQKQAQPLLQKARQLDTQISSSDSILDELTKKNITQQQQWEKTNHRYQSLNQQQYEQNQCQQRLAVWLEQQGAIKDIADEWGRWEVVIKDYSLLASDLLKREREKDTVEKNIVQQQGFIIKAQEKVNALNDEKMQLIEKTSAVKEIAIVLPPGLIPVGKSPDKSTEVLATTLIDVPDLERLRVDSSSISPDGYEFSIGRDRYSDNVFGGLFYSSRYRHQAVLTKNGRSIRLPNAVAKYYSQNTHFIGWVVSP